MMENDKKRHPKTEDKKVKSSSSVKGQEQGTIFFKVFHKIIQKISPNFPYNFNNYFPRFH